jgi:hypothetical protein
MKIATKFFHDALYNDPDLKGLNAIRHKMLGPTVMVADMGDGYGTYIVVAMTEQCFRAIPTMASYDDFK